MILDKVITSWDLTNHSFYEPEEWIVFLEARDHKSWSSWVLKRTILSLKTGRASIALGPWASRRANRPWAYLPEPRGMSVAPGPRQGRHKESDYLKSLLSYVKPISDLIAYQK